MGRSKFDKICIMCGKKYQYCSNCDRFRNYPRWMESFDNDNCHTIFNTIMEYRAGVKTIDQAAAVLKKCDLSYRDKINKDMDAFITAILADGKEEVKAEEPKVGEKKVEEPKAEVKKVAEEKKPEEKKAEEQKPEKKFNNYKKNNFNK